MVSLIVRLLKRFAVLVPGIVIAYFSAHYIYPVIDSRFVPAVLAVLVTYVIAAYLLIPLLIRLIRVVIRPKHLPHYSVTPDGFASDPVNIGLVGSRENLIESMQKAGWHLADKRSLASDARIVWSFFAKRDYLNAPMSALFLLGRKQDIGFEKPIPDKRGYRHHVRFWALSPEQYKRLLPDIDSKSGDYLWLGAASRDVGISIIRHNAQVTHMIAPDTDAERELIIKDLSRTQDVKNLKNINLGKPYKLINRAWGGYLQTDGVIKLYLL